MLPGKTIIKWPIGFVYVVIISSGFYKAILCYDTVIIGQLFINLPKWIKCTVLKENQRS